MQAPSPGGGPWRLGLGGVHLLYGLAGGRVSLRGVDLLSCCAVVDVRVDDPRAVSAALRSERGDGCELCCKRSRDELPYRTYDGTCNARDDLGAAFSPVKRISPSYYDGKDGRPRERSKSGRKLPSARKVSLEVHKAKAMPTHFSLMLMQFGQFLDHDLTVVPVATELRDTIKCCGVPEYLRDPVCFPIENPDEEQILGNCSEFVRSEPMTLADGTVPNPRQHVNAITAWLDASNIYGHD
ncbi:hypothetical protein ACOMHN_040069 [Nucella lapillus]